MGFFFFLDEIVRPLPTLNLVHRTEFLDHVLRKLGEERIEIRYHIFIALQDLLFISKCHRTVG